MNKKETLIKNLQGMKQYNNKDFIDLIKESFCTIKPSKRRNLIIILIITILLYPIGLCIKSNNTLILLKEFVELTNEIIMAMFGILFTGYALFQALINRNTLKILFLSRSKNENALFLEYNLYFFIMCILYITSILINYIILFVLTLIEPGTFNFNDECKTIISWIFILIYLYCNIFTITEIKSFIVNLFRCFNISAVSTMIEELPNYDDNLREKK
ncbi:hypothetical protein HMPREF1084_01741 [Clostridium butyricum 60E.3]|uniref:hypothetical protein n=1 Tax=Clostridium butyricum TaxID=1492 RepID=UPI0002D14B31|nr:hypothetical protein [Clostridium butyricum]ENZ33273.1 hypothetical protein HMPREF1084_01741 [Clostridium butyricum 60E.3]MDU1337586.1 hypothetical protein [Clostridium butyricum]MDU5102666.1 hypothetical protein [Clostridium butyricum]